MAVIWIREHWPQRGGTFGALTTNRQQRHWKILVNSKTDDQNTITLKGLQVGIFQVLFTQHPNNAFLFAKSVRVT